MFDTFVVTPIRIFVFLIFLGSAYSFMLRQGWERWRMGLIRQRLNGHTIVCGYGATGEAAVAELLARGTSPDGIVVVDHGPHRLRAVEALGVATVEGDATHNAVLETAGVAQRGGGDRRHRARRHRGAGDADRSAGWRPTSASAARSPRSRTSRWRATRART